MALQTLESVPSTMDVARKALLADHVHFDASGRPFPTGIRAEEQTQGRGQRGRTWFAQKGECLCTTYYFDWGLVAPEVAGQLSFLAGVAVVETLAALPLTLNSQPSTFGLKWPNDVLLNGRKVGGILVELTQTREGAWVALIGVGINVKIRNFPTELAEFATSLWREGVECEDIGGLAEKIGLHLEQLAHIRKQEGFEAVLVRWRTWDATSGRRFETTCDGENVQGIAEGVALDGALRLRLTDGRVLNVLSASSLQEKPLP